MVHQSSKLSKKTSAVSRTIRQVTAYATSDGERPLKKRGIEAFAPSVRPLTSTIAAESETIAPSSATGISEKTRKVLQDIGAPNRTSKTVSNIALQLGATTPVSSAVSVRRVEVKPPKESVAGGKASTLSASASLAESVADAVAIGSIERRVAADGTDATCVVVVVEDEKLALTIGTRLGTVYKIKVLNVLDSTVGFPSWPVAAKKQSAEISSEELCQSTVVVVATLDGLMGMQKRSAVWKHLGAMVVVASAAFAAQLQHEAVADAVRTLRSHIPASLCVVVGASIKDISQPNLSPIMDSHATTSAPSTPATTNASSTPAPASRKVVEYFNVQGAIRFQTLYQLITAQAAYGASTAAATNGRVVVTVHFATPEVAAFWCDVLIALNEVHSSATIICDSEDPTSARKSVRSDVLASTLGRVQSALQRTSGETGTIIVLSSFGVVVPASHGVRQVFVQYDPLVQIDQFTNFVGSQLAHVQTVLLFLRPNEVENGAVAILKGSLGASRFSVEYEPLALPGSANSSLLSTQRMKGLHKKMFVIANRSFDAYRASMQVYSRLHPSAVFNVRALDLGQYAAEFGFEDAPLLDLRTKVTPFRPTEDLKKASIQRLVVDRKAKKRFADDNLIGVGPEDHFVPEENNEADA